MKQIKNNEKYRKVIFLFMILSIIKIIYCYKYENYDNEDFKNYDENDKYDYKKIYKYEDYEDYEDCENYEDCEDYKDYYKNNKIYKTIITTTTETDTTSTTTTNTIIKPTTVTITTPTNTITTTTQTDTTSTSTFIITSTNTISSTTTSTSTITTTSTTTTTVTVLSTPYCQEITQNNINNAYITTQFEGPLSPFTYADCAKTCFVGFPSTTACFSLVRIPYPLGSLNPQYACTCYNSNYIPVPLNINDPPCITVTDSKGNPFIYGQGNYQAIGSTFTFSGSEFVYCINSIQ